jgi:hypothetical protein
MFWIFKRGFMVCPRRGAHIGNMNTKCLFPLALGILIFAAPSWASSRTPMPSPAATSIAPGSPLPVFRSSASPETLAVEELTGSASDALPVLSLQLKRVDLGIDLLVQQTSVGPASIDTGVGLMLSFKPS